MIKLFIYFLLFCCLLLTENSSGQNLHRDTTVLYRRGDQTVFIDYSPNSKYFGPISDFKFGDYDKESHEYSLTYLKDNGLKLTRKPITGLPKRWILLKNYKNNFYTYYPSDFYFHYKVSIADTAFIDYTGEGPMANKILGFNKINDNTFSFLLSGVEWPKRQLTIHVINKSNGIAIFEMVKDNSKDFFLMIDASKVKRLPIIVNLSLNNKAFEFDFEEPDFQRLLNGSIKIR